MLSATLILCIVIWVPILLYCLINRSFAVLLTWLLIAPIALNVIERPNRNPFFPPEMELDYIEQVKFEQAQRSKRKEDQGSWSDQPATVTMKDLLNPTRLLFFALPIVLLFEQIYRKRRPIPLDRAEFWMILFSAILIVNVLLLSARVPNGIRVSVDAFIVPFLGYATTRRYISSPERFRQFLWVMLAIGLYVIGIAVLERATHSDLTYRLRGPFPARNHLAAVMMMIFFMMLVDNFFHRDRFGVQLTLRQAGRWIVLVLAPLTIFATWTRSNWLGFLCGSWVLLLLARRLIPLERKLVSIGLGLLLLPVLFIGFQAMSPEEAVEDRIANVNTIYSRAGAWLIQLQEGIRHPLLGIGFNNVRELLANEQVYVMGIKSLSHSHNCFLAFFVELGVFGLFSYLAIVASIIRMGLSRYRQGPRLQDRWVGICAIAILIGYLVPGLTSTMLYIPTMSHVYVYVCLGALAGIDGIIRSSPPVKPFMATFGLKQNIP